MGEEVSRWGDGEGRGGGPAASHSDSTPGLTAGEAVLWALARRLGSLDQLLVTHAGLDAAAVDKEAAGVACGARRRLVGEDARLAGVLGTAAHAAVGQLAVDAADLRATGCGANEAKRERFAFRACYRAQSGQAEAYAGAGAGQDVRGESQRECTRQRRKRMRKRAAYPMPSRRALPRAKTSA